MRIEAQTVKWTGFRPLPASALSGARSAADYRTYLEFLAEYIREAKQA